MKRHNFTLDRPAITADDFPLTLPRWTSAPFVLSAYVGKSEEHFSVLQAWRVTRDRYDLLDQFRERTEFDDFQDRLDEDIELYRPAAVLASSAPEGKALMARLLRRHPHLVEVVEVDRGSEDAQLRALFEAVIERRISFPAEAPWRDLCVRQFCAAPKGKFRAAVRGAMQVVSHAHHLMVPTAHLRRCAAPGVTERPAIAARMVGFRAVTVDRRHGERPGLWSAGHETANRLLGGPILHISTEVKY